MGTFPRTKRDWLLYLSVIRPLGRVLAIQSSQGSQTFCRQSEVEVFTGPKIRKWPVNVLRGTDPDPYFIWKWDPNPCRPDKCLKCTTRTRRRPDHYSKVGPEPVWEDTDPTVPVPIGTYCTANAMKSINIAKKTTLFALTTVISPLPDCDAYNPPCQYMSIHVRLFLSLADWKSFLIHSLFQLQKYTVTETDD